MRDPANDPIVPLTETAALEITALRAIESADAGRDFWSEEDRAWASRAAGALVGAAAPPEAFLAARARLGMDRIGERSKALRRTLTALSWHPWVGYLIVALAFTAGFALDQVGASQRVNLLAPPLFGVLAWNLGVYALLIASYVVRYGESGAPRPLRRGLVRLATGRGPSGRGQQAALVAHVVDDWTRQAAALYAARAARVLHLAAVALACGLLAGLYLRGIALDYAATWESTFLDAATVRRLLEIVLAPGAAWTGLAVPPLSGIEAIRAPAGENAGRWLHLIAATVVALVILPRFALAAANALLERYRSARLVPALDAPYYARLLRGFSGGPARVRVIPYSYTLSSTSAGALERLLRAVVGDNATVTIASPVTYGSAEGAGAADGAPRAEAATDSHVIALFNAAGTPEPDVHGAFLADLARRSPPAPAVIALIDDGPFRERLMGDPQRMGQRHDIWRALCSNAGVACAFATLDANDPGAAILDLEAALARSER